MPFAIALAVSALLHVAAITLPGWDLPGLSESEPPVIEAHLAPPKPVTLEPRRENDKPKPPPRPRVAQAAPAPTGEAAPAVEPALPAPLAIVEPPATVPAAPAPLPTPPWGKQIRIRYSATYGEGGFVIGETRQEFVVDGGRYTLRSTFEPKGLAALRGRTRSQASEGEVTFDGLRPREFRDQREGREPESAALDWVAGKVAFSGDRGEAVLPAAAQDLLSVFYQLGWLAPRQSVDMVVTTASRVGRWTFEYLGEETLTVFSGPLATLHLRTQAEGDTTEVWLATARGGLPVKIRYMDRKGEVFEQVAKELETN
jgi:hypothetical protein